ncbi:uncharacterized protein LOC129250871 [Anastrepha obliqua]|uniref:uncharacterized protein LOC128871582 n=1 Tax=Anastrepha ludens TaxID=28586 RepID=UPI0023B1A49F|nr:uncharacterized protein LOC128871582 [Anastrepha ludens]XP_054746456.1 uncharacterized protein LOC129250871 [Anastrepha obliqua]XP_054746457.1 uncharacterized protein LOC129250871 [Anastrepha obliqua]
MEQLSNENPHIKQITMWSDRETRLLLDRYDSYSPEIGPMGKIRNKKEMWQMISEEIEGRTAKQCEERFKTVMKKRKTAHRKNKHTSREKRQRVDNEQEVYMSTLEMEKEVDKKKTLQETLLEIAQRKEEARERRHREKMESLNNIHQLLTNLLYTS